MLRIVLILVLVAILALAGWFFVIRDSGPADTPPGAGTGTPIGAPTATVDPAVGAMISFRPPSSPPARATLGGGGFMSAPRGMAPQVTPQEFLEAEAYMTAMNNTIATQISAMATRNAGGGGAATARPRSAGSSRSSGTRVSNVPRDAWLGSYYAGVKASGNAIMVRRDANIDMNWGGGAPAPGLPADSFSIKWQRLFTGDGGVYRIRAVTDDGLRVKLDGKVILNAFSDGPKDTSVDFGMAARDHEIQVEYFENRGDARARIWIERPSDPHFPDWKAEYYNNITLSGSPALTRNEKTPKLSFGANGPDEALDAGYFSARLTKSIDFDRGDYEFSVKADDGIRVWVDGNQIIDEWHGSDGKETYTEIETLNGDKDVKIEYYNSFDKGSFSVTWKLVSGTGDSGATHTPGPTDTGTPAPPTPTVPSPTTGPTRTPTLTPPPSDTPTPTEEATPTETETPEPPTDTPEPPTDTPEPPTETPTPI